MPQYQAGSGLEFVENKNVKKSRPKKRNRVSSVRSAIGPTAMLDSTTVPVWLELPSDAAVRLPVESRQQVLPVGELTWENFERLCVRIARAEVDIEHCQLYGERGDAQDGIDLYARQRGAEAYAVYQCKRVKRFNAAALKLAVKTFLAGRWAGRATRFIVCTTAAGRARGIADEFERQRVLLKKRGVALELLDQDAISTALKAQPFVVDDFFGRAWVSAFCGTDAVTLVEGRLDINQVIEFRRALREFYGFVFNLHDPGIAVPPQPGTATASLSERYVLPDVVAAAPAVAFVSNSSLRTSSEQALDDRAYEASKSAARNEGERRSGSRRHSQILRESVTSWLAKSDRSVVLGVPGSGKSSLLRYLVLDLLSDVPKLPALGTRWAQRLPVWVPFAFWTKLIASGTGQDASLGECIRRWFAQWNKEDLWPIVRSAIDDQRLLLIVDGLDEWTTEEAGRIGAQLLQAFAETHRVAVVLTSRPYGLRRLSAFSGQDWQSGELAPLSLEQRSELCRLWFLIKARLDAQATGLDAQKQTTYALRESERFQDELSRSPELVRLAQTPLLLVLLLYMRFQQAVLPRRRFDAYDRILDHLIRDHPAAKRAAAFLTEAVEPLGDQDVRLTLAQLAFEIHSAHASAVVNEAEVEQIVFRFLTDQGGLGLGLSQAEARSYLPQFSRVAEGTLGVLVRQGVRELSFLHRSFQEFLASHHLSRLPLTRQETFLSTNGSDARWKEVVLGLLWRTKRPDDVERLITKIEPLANDTASGLSVRELLAEVAFGEFGCTPQTANRLGEETIARIETHAWMPHRRRLLVQMLDGLRSPRQRDSIRQRLRRWIYCRSGWRPSWYEAMDRWPAEGDVVRFLFVRLHDEDAAVQRAASHTLAKIARGNVAVGDVVASLATRDADPLIRAAALEGLYLGWPEHPALTRVIDAAREAPSSELRLAAIDARVNRGQMNDSDFREVVKIAHRQQRWNLEHGWQRLTAQCLIRGWPGVSELKTLCLSSVHRHQDGEIDSDVALPVLLSAFPNDPDVADWCANEIRTQDHPFLGMSQFDQWAMLAQNFRDNAAIIAAIEEWAPRQKFGGPEVSFAALVGRTESMKRKCIADLHNSFPHWVARSLLKGWGLNTADVAEALVALATGPVGQASEIALMIPEIISDQSVARSRLLDLMRDPHSRRHDFIITGLASLTSRGDEAEIADVCLDTIRNQNVRRDASAAYQLISLFGHVPAVRQFALDSVGWREPPIAALAHAFSADPEIRGLTMDLAGPMPVELRREIVTALDRLDDSLVLTTLREYDAESDEEVKTLASIAYHKRAAQDAAERQSAIDRLSLAIRAYGPDYETRRRAAFAGLLLIDGLGVMKDVTETIGDPRPVSITLSSGLGSNLVLIGLIAERWNQFKASFPDDFQDRLSKFSSPVWELLCLAGPEPAEFRDDVLNSIRADDSLRFHPHALLFLSRLIPRSAELRDSCIAAVRHKGTRPWVAIPDSAASILADQFGGDPNVLQMLIGTDRPTLIDEALVLALCVGWPESSYVKELYDELLRPDRCSLPWPVYFNLMYARKPASEIVGQLRRDVATSPTGVLKHLASAVVQRLRRDDEARTAIKGVIAAERVSPGAKATVPRILAAAGGLGLEDRSWCERQLSEEFDKNVVPELGFDLMEGEVRAVGISLLDALEGAGSVIE